MEIELKAYKDLALLLLVGTVCTTIIRNFKYLGVDIKQNQHCS